MGDGAVGWDLNAWGMGLEEDAAGVEAGGGEGLDGDAGVGVGVEEGVVDGGGAAEAGRRAVRWCG